MRTIADQSIDDLGGPGSALERQRRDHVELDRLLERCANSEGQELEEALNQTWRLVFSLAFAEEAVLWPAVRRVLDDGESLTRQVEQEHQQINELVLALERSGPDAPGRQALLDRIVAPLREDVRDEEDVLLPRLQEALDAPTLNRLGRSWELVRRTAPTRPHPVVSRRPPGNVLAALPLTMIDRGRDVLDRQARRRSGRLAEVSRQASRRLLGVANVIEQLPPLRRGEHPSTVATGGPPPKQP